MQIHAAQRKIRQIKTAQVPPQHTQQRQQVGRSIPLGIFGPGAHLVKKGTHLCLHAGIPQGCGLQTGKQGSQQHPLLNLPHIVLGVSQGETMLDQA